MYRTVLSPKSFLHLGNKKKILHYLGQNQILGRANIGEAYPKQCCTVDPDTSLFCMDTDLDPDPSIIKQKEYSKHQPAGEDISRAGPQS